ncbi:MAG: hypothetical protein IPJ65_03985 [Archangiaceae bacterium]|nr:hypothetical protein [Archangiaceae bacterium]
MSTREELTGNLTAYIDNELSELEARRIEEALRLDPELAALEQKLRTAVKAVEALPAPAPATAALRRAVLQRLDEKTALQRLRGFFTLPRLVPVAGLAAAAAITVVVVGRPVDKPGLDDETLFVAQNIEVLEDLDLIGLENPDDLDVVANLHELEVRP